MFRFQVCMTLIFSAKDNVMWNCRWREACRGRGRGAGAEGGKGEARHLEVAVQTLWCCNHEYGDFVGVTKYITCHPFDLLPLYMYTSVFNLFKKKILLQAVGMPHL